MFPTAKIYSVLKSASTNITLIWCVGSAGGCSKPNLWKIQQFGYDKINLLNKQTKPPTQESQNMRDESSDLFGSVSGSGQPCRAN